jgi:hypothetical protein
VLDEENRDVPDFPETLEQRVDLTDPGRIESRCGLVEKQEPRARGKRSRDLDSASLPER